MLAGGRLLLGSYFLVGQASESLSHDVACHRKAFRFPNQKHKLIPKSETRVS